MAQQVRIEPPSPNGIEPQATADERLSAASEQRADDPIAVPAAAEPLREDPTVTAERERRRAVALAMEQAVLTGTPLPKPDEEVPYTTGAWSGYTNYLCTRCPHATLDIERAIRHHAEQHLGQLPVEED